MEPALRTGRPLLLVLLYLFCLCYCRIYLQGSRFVEGTVVRAQNRGEWDIVCLSFYAARPAITI